MAYQSSTNLYQNTKYVVSAAGATPYATVQSAINAANTAGIPATVFIRPGTYTENLTLYSTIDLEGTENSQVTIVGTHTPPTSGSLAFNRIGFTSTTHILSSASAGTTAIKFSRCVFNITNGYVCNLANWTGAISIKYCTEGTSTSSGVITNAGASAVSIYNSVLGAGTANAMTINGSLEIFNLKLWCPLTMAGSSMVILEGGSTFRGTLTTSATVDVKIRNSTISTSTATAISHSSSVALLLNNVVIDSTNATCIAGTGSIQFNEATFVNSKTLAGTITEILTGVVKTGEIYADTVSRMDMTGWYSFSGAAPYFDDTTLGSFTILAAGAGTGYIHGKKITWTGPQTIAGMTSGSTWFIYIDATGTIGKTNSRTDSLFVDNVVLFECLYDETSGTKVQYTVKENHNYNFQVNVSNYLHETVGAVIENANNGANIVAGTTGARVSISGNDVLTDHGLDTNIVAGTDKTWNKMYTTAGGKWARDGAAGTDFLGRYNNAGTPTNLTAGRYAIYTLYVSKDNINSTSPIYFAVLDTAQYASSSAANTAISNGTTAKATNELESLELAQLGFIIFRQSTGAIVQFTISKSTLRSTLSTGSTNQASLILTDTSGFNGILSAADTNVQAALDTIDNWGSGTTNHAVILGAGVGTALNALAVGTTGKYLRAVTTADPAWSTLTLPDTVAIGDVLIATSSNTVAAVSGAATSGWVLTANGAGTSPTFQAGAGGGIATLAGDSGTATGATVTIAGTTNQITTTAGTATVTLSIPSSPSFGGTTTVATGLTVTSGNVVIHSGNLTLPTSSSTVGQIQINSARYLHNVTGANILGVYNENCHVGKECGNLSYNWYGAMYSLGYQCLYNATSGYNMTAIGHQALYTNVDGSNCIAIGYSALYNMNTNAGNGAFFNIAIGNNALINITYGERNLAIGCMDTGVGTSATGGDSNNIYIMNLGAHESNVMRLGTSGSGNNQVNKAYIAGIYNITPGGGQKMIVIDANEQLGTQNLPINGIYWSVRTTDLNPMVVDNGYIANKAGLLTFTLPTTCAVGKILRVTGMNTAVGWRIAQNANQIIHFGTSTTTTGVAGYIEATNIHDSVELVCCVADLEFIVISSSGNITIA